MDPSDYLAFTAVDLVETSRNRRSSESQITLVAKKLRKFHFFFAKNSLVTLYLSNKRRVGNCLVFLSGKIVIGPRIDAFILSLSLLVLLGTQVIITTTLPLLIPQSEESTVGWTDWTLSLIVNLLIVISIVLMLLTGLTNPGIIPKNESGTLAPGVDPNAVDSTTGFLVPRFILLNGVCVRQKFCRTCKIYRPPRSNHCSVCDNCVLRHDHHCVALGTCVGLGNYRWFLLLSGSLALLCPLVFWLVKNQVLSLGEETVGEIKFLTFLYDNFMLMFLAVVSLVGSIAFVLLFVYHYFITAHNLTTNEHLKKYYKVNPFDYGKAGNFKHALCFPQELLPVPDTPDMEASYKELASTNSECVSDFYDY